jgi:hypothetical protein
MAGLCVPRVRLCVRAHSIAGDSVRRNKILTQLMCNMVTPERSRDQPLSLKAAGRGGQPLRSARKRTWVTLAGNWPRTAGISARSKSCTDSSASSLSKLGDPEPTLGEAGVIPQQQQQPYGASSGTCAAASIGANPESLGSSAISTWRRNGRKPERL